MFAYAQLGPHSQRSTDRETMMMYNGHGTTRKARKNVRNWGRAFSGASGEKNWGAHGYSCVSGECD